ncbi:uncharacterized protein VTP21DRAFT_983 [Calcarisporiella thermophila]|uniref:uncharacterized protein n=1 Tax=Calcarisporiella thermophila TaxID=911321 RepID=UPI0037423E75
MSSEDSSVRQAVTSQEYISIPVSKRLSTMTGEEKSQSWTSKLKDNFGTAEGWFGNYDYGFLCMPRIPWLTRRRHVSPFFALNTKLPIVLALVMGFQHSLAMISGIVTPPLIISGSGDGHLNLPDEDRQYLISASLLCSGFLSILQISRFRLFKTRYYVGAGLISVVGTTFTIIPLAEAVIKDMYKTGFCPSTVGPDGILTNQPCPQAWGAIIGTALVTSVIQMALSFLPPRFLSRLFPPIVTGTTVTLMGTALIAAGLKSWGGGAGPCISRPQTGFFSLCPNTSVPNALAWGDSHWIGLGFSVFATILLIEFFGSPFMKNASVHVIIGLIVGTIIAAATGHVNTQTINSAPVITFLWVKGSYFGFSVYPPAILPLVIVYLVSVIECIGDVTASCDVSNVAVEGPEFETRIQGSVLANGISSALSSIMTNSPMVTFAQNNGIIALTRCANLGAGYACCFFLILMGVFAKIAAFFLAIPDATLGGMTTFLFATVTGSGIRILAYLDWTRRDRFIVASALSIGMGVNMVPGWFEHVIVYNGDSGAIRGLVSSVNVFVGTGFCIGGFIAIILNLILPKEEAEFWEEDVEAASGNSLGHGKQATETEDVSKEN